jgi:hypothetical protein
VYHLIERDPSGAPAAFRVVGFDPHYVWQGGIPAPYLEGPDDEVLLLSRLAGDEFAASPEQALEQSDRQHRLLGGAEGVLQMLYTVRIWDGKGRLLVDNGSLTEEQAQTAYQQALRQDPDAVMTLIPRYEVKADGRQSA